MRPVSWFITLAAGAAIAVCVAGSSFAKATIGQPAPALVVQQLDGQTFDLATLHGRIVIVNFWATWCPPCREEMPALNTFYQNYRDKGLVMIGVSADRPHDRSDVAKVMQSFSYPAAMLRDAAANGFGSPTTLPTTFIVDRDGIVRARLTPDETKVTEASLAAAVLPLLPSKRAF